MQLEPIDDLEDPRLAGYRSLKDAELAARHGRFVVEGRGNVVFLLARSAYAPESILLGERAWSALEPQIRSAAPACPVFIAPQPLLDAIVGFPIHRGALALCRRKPPRDPLELARSTLAQDPAPRILALEGLIDHDNVGGIFRSAMAFGARGVVLSPRSCDPLYRKAIRTSMGGALCVPFARAPHWPAVLGSLADLGYEILALDPGREGVGIGEIDPARLGAAVLLLGTEGSGLSEAALARADRRIRIGMEPGVDSLNVSVAAGIALHRLRRDEPAPGT